MLSAINSRALLLLSLLATTLLANIDSTLLRTILPAETILCRSAMLTLDQLSFWVACVTANQQATILQYTIGGTLLNQNTWGTQVKELWADINSNTGEMFACGATATTGTFDGMPSSGGSSDSFITRFSATGEKINTYRWGSLSSDGAVYLSIDAATNTIITVGFRNADVSMSPSQSTNTQLEVTKFTNALSVVWTYLVASANSELKSAVGKDGYVYACGKQSTGMYFLKLDASNGNIITSKIVSGEVTCSYITIDRVSGQLLITGNTKFLLAGAANSYHDDWDSFTSHVRTTDLSMMDTTLYGTSKEELTNGIYQHPVSGEFYVYGSTRCNFFSTNQGATDLFLFKLRPDLFTSQWGYQIGSTGEDHISHVTMLEKGRLVIVGMYDNVGYLAIYNQIVSATIFSTSTTTVTTTRTTATITSRTTKTTPSVTSSTTLNAPVASSTTLNAPSGGGAAPTSTSPIASTPAAPLTPKTSATPTEQLTTLADHMTSVIKEDLASNGSTNILSSVAVYVIFIGVAVIVLIAGFTGLRILLQRKKEAFHASQSHLVAYRSEIKLDTLDSTAHSAHSNKKHGDHPNKKHGANNLDNNANNHSKRPSTTKSINTKSAMPPTTSPMAAAPPPIPVASGNATRNDQTWEATQHELSIPAFLFLRKDFDFRLGVTIAEGGMSRVYECIPLSPGLGLRSKMQPLVAKVIAKDSSILPPGVRDAFLQEISIMYRFRDHPNFAQLYGFAESPVALIIKHYRYGDMKSFAFKKGQASMQFTYSKMNLIICLKQVCSALAYMHECGFSHSDIKPNNIFLDVTGNVGDRADPLRLVPVLADFGISKVLDVQNLSVGAFVVSNVNGRSAMFASPELYHGRLKNSGPIWKCVDVYALSMTILFMLTRRKLKFVGQ